MTSSKIEQDQSSPTLLAVVQNIYANSGEMLGMFKEMKRDLDAHIAMENSAIGKVEELFKAFPDKDLIKHRIEHMLMGEARENRKKVFWIVVTAILGAVTLAMLSAIGSWILLGMKQGMAQ